MPARREPLHEPALDEQQARLVVLDHMLGDQRVALARNHRQVPRLHLRVAGHVDALDLDAGHDLPEHADLPRRHQVRRPAVEADDRHLLGLGLDHLEQLRREIAACRLEHGKTIGRVLGAHDLVPLDRELLARIEQGVAARLEHPLEPAVARQEGTLAVLHRHAQHQQGPVHNTSPSLAARDDRTTWLQFRGCGSRTRASRKDGGPGLEPMPSGGRARPFAVPQHDARAANPSSARRYPPRHRVGLTVSRDERGAFRRNDRTATEARVRSPSGQSAFQTDGISLEG